MTYTRTLVEFGDTEFGLTERRWVYTEVCCDHCGVKLEPVAQKFHSADTLSYADTLIVSLRGGYGMFIDPTDFSHGHNPEFDKVVCGACAAELFNWLGATCDG